MTIWDDIYKNYQKGGEAWATLSEEIHPLFKLFLINRIYEAIVANGKIFITVPDFESSKKWNTFKDHEELAKGTFAPLSGPEQGLPHSFYTKEEVQKLFSKFRELQLDLDSHGRWIAQAYK